MRALARNSRTSLLQAGLFDAESCAPDPVEIHLVDAFAWLEKAPPASIHAVVTDPPYGLVEYSAAHLAKRKTGRGGVWRIPPSFDGCRRSPLPRFTVLTQQDRADLSSFFARFARALMPVLVPGAHVFVATNPLVSHLVYEPFVLAGFEKRGEIIRVVQTLRGGDRPKNAHREFDQVTVMPRSCWEPWGLFRKPCEGRVQDNLRKWKTGGLRRVSEGGPFRDLIVSAPTRPEERRLAPHPSLKPQHFMRQLVHAALPLGEGTILDPFMGAGSTVAAALACGLRCIGLELREEYFDIARKAIPVLARLEANGTNGNGTSRRLQAERPYTAVGTSQFATGRPCRVTEMTDPFARGSDTDKRASFDNDQDGPV